MVIYNDLGMMQEELIKQCRFYKGESECPDEMKHYIRGYLFWNAEQLWVSQHGIADASSILFLVNCGLSDEDLLLRQCDEAIIDISLDLRAIMFQLFCRYSDISPLEEAKFFVSIVLPEYLNK